MKVISFNFIDFKKAKDKKSIVRKVLFFKQNDLYYNLGIQKTLKIEKDNKILKIDVPADFYSNGLTIPYFLKKIINPIDYKYSEASFYHDFLYTYRKNLIIKDEIIHISRAEADFIFYQILKIINVNIVTRCFFYIIVRLFGWQYIK